MSFLLLNTEKYIEIFKNGSKREQTGCKNACIKSLKCASTIVTDYATLLAQRCVINQSEQTTDTSYPINFNVLLSFFNISEIKDFANTMAVRELEIVIPTINFTETPNEHSAVDKQIAVDLSHLVERIKMDAVLYDSSKAELSNLFQRSVVI